VKNRSFQKWVFRSAVAGVVISLLGAIIAAPEATSFSGEQINQNMTSATAGHSTAPGFGSTVEYVYFVEPVTGNLTKLPSSPRDIVPDCYASFMVHENSLYPGKYRYFSDKMPRKSFRQVCLLLDLPPPLA
jgi:hypothetical protein